MLLSELLYKVQMLSVQGDTSVEISNVQSDSRTVTANSCFIAINGTVNNGQQYITQAIQKGAKAIVAEAMPEQTVSDVTYVMVKNAAQTCATMSHTFYGSPSLKMKVTGVTGTNGKTTVTTLLYNLFTELGYTCGLIGTVGIKIGDKEVPATHTTPDAITLNRLLSEMYESGCTHVFMECSSHAIHQHRIDGLLFTGAVFTNITHDHLDYHQTFEEYIRVKKSWFDTLPGTAFALTNADDKRGMVVLQNTAATKLTYGFKTLATFRGKIMENSLEGLQLLIDDKEVFFRMVGEFNAYNLLAVYGASVALGEDKDAVLLSLSNLEGAEGRFERVQSDYKKVLGIVDYAHTPDALLNVLVTVNRVRDGKGKLITVVGCGGNRDKSKRPLMGAVACEYSDKVVFTSDNPRNEDAEEIIREMEVGVKITQRKKYVSITDRKEAIKVAVSMSEPHDVVLVAGKGHEKYQEVKGVKFEFDDKTVLAEMLHMFEK